MTENEKRPPSTESKLVELSRRDLAQAQERREREEREILERLATYGGGAD
jgi:hypothetical protein